MDGQSRQRTETTPPRLELVANRTNGPDSHIEGSIFWTDRPGLGDPDVVRRTKHYQWPGIRGFEGTDGPVAKVRSRACAVVREKTAVRVDWLCIPS